MSEKQKDGGKAREIRRDAEGQFADNQHGAHSSGVASARASVVTGTEDATFDTDPEEKHGKKQSGGRFRSD